MLKSYQNTPSQQHRFVLEQLPTLRGRQDVVANSSAQNQVGVVVVDDEPLVRTFLRQLLERDRKYRVMTAASGEEALRLSRQSTDSIDVLITDFDLGQMNGIDLYRQLALERPGTAVLFILSDSDLFREFYSDLPFVKRPFAPRDFLAKLEQVHAIRLAEAETLSH